MQSMDRRHRPITHHLNAWNDDSNHPKTVLVYPVGKYITISMQTMQRLSSSDHMIPHYVFTDSGLFTVVTIYVHNIHLSIMYHVESGDR
jgi:hypothetical protein